MARRDPFKRYAVADLEGGPTLKSGSGRLRSPLQEFQKDVKLVEQGYRYSIISKPGDRATFRPRVMVEKRIGTDWEIIQDRSLSGNVDPAERAAITMNEQGHRAVALILLHALTETLMRADPKADYKDSDRFVDVVDKFHARIVERFDEPVSAAKLRERLLTMNNTRNDVIHLWLGRDGLDATNARLTAADFGAWRETYEGVLYAVIDFLSL